MTINLAAIEMRLKAITKWPWSIAYGGINESDEGFGINSKIEPGIVAECWPPTAADAERKRRCYADAHFIAHAPEDIAVLVAEVRRLAKAVADISHLASGHHREQPSHVLLHCLTIDIPAICDAALTTTTSE